MCSLIWCGARDLGVNSPGGENLAQFIVNVMVLEPNVGTYRCLVRHILNNLASQSQFIRHRAWPNSKLNRQLWSEPLPPHSLASNLAKNSILLFSLFIRAYLVAQESVVLSNSCILGDMTCFSLKCYTIKFFSKKMAYFNVNCHFVYIMKIHKYETKPVLKNNNAHNNSLGFFTCSKVLITYEPWNKCGSHHVCTLITSFIWRIEPTMVVLRAL